MEVVWIKNFIPNFILIFEIQKLFFYNALET